MWSGASRQKPKDLFPMAEARRSIVVAVQRKNELTATISRKHLSKSAG